LHHIIDAKLEDFQIIHSVNKLVFARNSSLKWLFVGTYRTVVPRYLWYCAQHNAVHCSHWRCQDLLRGGAKLEIR